MAVTTTRAQQYLQLARYFHFMARSLPHGQNRSTLLGMAEECDRLADQCERLADHQEQGADRAYGRKFSPSSGVGRGCPHPLSPTYYDDDTSLSRNAGF